MHTNKDNVYTPQISRKAAFVLRRLAWLQGKPMTKTLNKLILIAMADMDIVETCKVCKYTKGQCKICPIKKGVAQSIRTTHKTSPKKGS